MTEYDEERIAVLLRLLPPAPPGWVEAAKQLPSAREAIESIVARAESNTVYRARVLADLEAALEAEGLEASPAALAALRGRLVTD